MARLRPDLGWIGAALVAAAVAAESGPILADGPARRSSADRPGPGSGFTSLPPERTGILFSNTILQTLQVNLYNFEYLYNGGGVAIGDVDRDGLPDVYLTATLGRDRLYRNRGDFRFEDITDRAGIAASTGIRTGVVMADLNGDGWLDIYVCRTGKVLDDSINDLVYLNNRDSTFTESAAALGLVDRSTTTHATFLDYDLDGDLDLFLLNQRSDFKNSNVARMMEENGRVVRLRGAQQANESDRLFRNDGGTFRDVSAAAGINTSAFGLGVAVADLNNDGYPDLYVANDYIEPDYAFINNRDGTFTDEAAERFRHTSMNSMGVDAADIDNDGFADLVVLDMLAEDNYRQKALLNNMYYSRYATLVDNGFGHQLGRNVLQLNNRNGTFSEIGELAGIARTDWSWAPLVADFDNDGWKDLFVTNGYRYDVNNADYLKFTLDELRRSQPLTGDAQLAVYLQNIPTAKLGNYLFRNAGALSFENRSAAWGVDAPSYSSGAAYGDLDRDGDLDLVVNNIDEPAQVLRNESRRGGAGPHFLEVTLDGPPGNRSGVGARAEISVGGGLQVVELQPSRGFESSVEPVIHFGLGGAAVVDTLSLRWPDGRHERRSAVPANQRLVLRYADAAAPAGAAAAVAPATIFRPARVGADFTHRENDFIDFKREPLIPHMLSRGGPYLATGDVNGDGREDFFVGGAAGQEGAIYLQGKGGDFTASRQPALAEDRAFEDAGALLFDADGDSDLDLYVASGGSEFEPENANYQDRLYRNDGSGTFRRETAALPAEAASGSAVGGADFDGDGDTDLFVGGRVVPGRYPEAPRSILLRNDGGRFTSVGETLLPRRGNLGLVTAAVWADLEADGFPDLLIAGEWMPITLLRNRGGKLEDATAAAGLGSTRGWWNALVAADVDGDRDLDLVAGNLGRNSRLKASAEEPLRIYADDFDKNGSLDAIVSWYNGGEEYPLPQKDLLLNQIPSLKKRFLRYHSYAVARMSDLFPPADLDRALKLDCQLFDSGVFENLGAGGFRFRPLPVEAQLAPVNGILVEDFDRDGDTDLLLAGNSFETEVETGRYDASNGQYLEATSAAELRPVHFIGSGFFAPGNTRMLARLALDGGGTLVLVARNDDSLLAFSVGAPKSPAP